MVNRYIVIGWLGGNSELFQFLNFEKGKQTSKELKKSPVWVPVWGGSLINLIEKLRKETNESWTDKINSFMKLYKILPESHHEDLRDCLAKLQTLTAIYDKEKA